VGSALIAAAVDVCERWANIIRIELQVYTDNHAAIAIYKKHGLSSRVPAGSTQSETAR
jgi:putative acetyltransferase